MAYIGSSPINKGTGLFSQDTFTGDGSTTTFDLTNIIPDGGGNDIQVFVDNVRQQEGSSNAYTIGNDGSGDLKRITFTAAPASAAAIYVLNPGTRNVQQISTVSDNAVTTAKVQANAITVAKLASTLDLSSNTITLPNNVVTTDKITDANVTLAKVAADAVNATKIADDSISEEHLDITAITANAELAEPPASDDVLLVFDTSAGVIKKVQRSNLIIQVPVISSVSPSSLTSGDGTGNYTIVVTGTGFDSSPTVSFINNSGTTINAASTTRNSATQLTAVVAKSSFGTDEPFDVKVTNANGQTTTGSDLINVNEQPVYTTSAGSLGTFNGNSAVSVTVNATDPESAGNVTFELQSGSLPAGLSLTNEGTEGGTARISGTATNPASNTVSSFVLRAVDAASNTSSRSFSITINRLFTTESFTSDGTFSVPSGVSSADVLVVAGGGAGGHGFGGGGGAGGLIFRPSYPVTAGGTVAITVGGGASPGSPGCSNPGGTGSDSVFGASPSPGTPAALTAKGGGGGAGQTGPGRPGGSGGGAGKNSPRTNKGTATQPTQSGDSGAYGFGNPGGNGSTNSNDGPGGGGGGAGAVGGDASPGCQTAGGAGGIGKAYTIADGTTSVYYAGGGGGGAKSSTGGPGGQGGGGRGAPAAGGQGNTGGGGGGGPQFGQGGNGGKGIVIVRY